jgi:diguanylate cyclase (GGDEF)-like protein
MDAPAVGAARSPGAPAQPADVDPAQVRRSEADTEPVPAESAPAVVPLPALIETVADLTAQRDRESLEVSLAQLLLAQLGARGVTYHRLHLAEDGMRLWPRLRCTRDGVRPLEAGAELQRLPRLEGARRRCVQERVALRLSVRGDERCAYLFPVLAEHEAVGLIEADGVAAMLAPECERAVANLLRIYRNHLALLDYGEHDTLTSLRNRRTFEADFAQLQRGSDVAGAAVRDLPAHGSADARAPVPPDAPHWLAVVDVDRFKRINDAFGHLYGDEVLLLLAQTMRAQFRPVDRLYRFGGEEFVIVLSRTPPPVASLPLERLRRAIESRRFSRDGQVTVSIGFTRIGPMDDAASAFDRADAALYHAKQNGRNQAHAWEDLVAARLLAPRQSEAVVELCRTTCRVADLR